MSSVRCGTEGTVRWDQRGGIEVMTKNEELVDLSRFEVPDAPADIAEDMVSAITKGTDPVVSGEEGRKSVKVFSAAYASSKSGSPVVIDQR